ncbi:tryptorubin family RiPP precursor [Streptomyces venezuelae]|nr:tryptorubin family RiPP precursor [Streptomyces venezuelae]
MLAAGPCPAWTPTESTGGMHMKVVRSLKKKITGEKSLKAYAWYHWY